MSNRVIKFRIWDVTELRYIEVYDMDPNGQWVHVARDDQCHLVNNPEKTEFILEQFTGLLDKNDKEIYEGDVVKIHEFREYLGGSYPGQYIVWPEYILLVEWKGPDQGYGIGYFSHRRQGIEIIGNVHENPELLK